MDVAVIGDVSGHPEELVHALRVLGADPTTLALPTDVTVVQVGGLLDPGPDPEAVLDIIELQLATGRWIQLLGSDEAAAAGLQPEDAPSPAPDRRGPSPSGLGESDRKRLADWWDSGRIRAAAAVRVAGHPSMLVTHAGLTHGLWYELRSPTSPEDTVRKLGDIARSDRARFLRSGHMHGAPRSMAAGPVWASASDELYPSLTMGVELGTPLPFGQIHGHSSPYSWARGTWRATERDRPGLRLVRDRRQVVGTVAGQPMASVAPELGAAGGVRWEPLVLRDATVTASA